MNLGNPELGSATLFHHSLFPEALLLELSQGFCPVLFLSGHIFGQVSLGRAPAPPQPAEHRSTTCPPGLWGRQRGQALNEFFKEMPT